MTEKHCLYCNELLHEGKNKFCNRHCSGSYSAANARKHLVEKTLNDPKWHSRRSQALWSDPEYIKKVKDKTFDNPEWKSKYQSKENAEYMIQGYRDKYKNDPEFRTTEIKKSQKAYKKNRALEYKGVYFRSSWELRFAKSLDEENIDWVYEPEIYYLGYTHYIPDFHLPLIDAIIEIKPFRFVTEVVEKKLEDISKYYKMYFLVTEENWDNILSSIKDLCASTVEV